MRWASNSGRGSWLATSNSLPAQRDRWRACLSLAWAGRRTHKVAMAKRRVLWPIPRTHLALQIRTSTSSLPPAHALRIQTRSNIQSAASVRPRIRKLCHHLVPSLLSERASESPLRSLSSLLPHSLGRALQCQFQSVSVPELSLRAPVSESECPSFRARVQTLDSKGEKERRKRTATRPGDKRRGQNRKRGTDGIRKARTNQRLVGRSVGLAGGRTGRRKANAEWREFCNSAKSPTYQPTSTVGSSGEGRRGGEENPESEPEPEIALRIRGRSQIYSGIVCSRDEMASRGRNGPGRRAWGALAREGPGFAHAHAHAHACAHAHARAHAHAHARAGP
ncbi:hypothetical protein C8Q70DRAFT_587991 [Cubamyces menziesii]|nr:hypothetical protein C8Q70DRAFT_587991 [Cubamyces menziesii]